MTGTGVRELVALLGEAFDGAGIEASGESQALMTNLATVAISLAGVLIFARIVKRLSLPFPAALTLTFAFLPLLCISADGSANICRCRLPKRQAVLHRSR